MKMRRITLRLLIAVCTFVLGVAVAGLWALRKFDLRNAIGPRKERAITTKTEADAQSGWEKVDMDGVTFFIPSDLRPILRDAPRPYRDFVNDRMEFFIYRRSKGSPACEEDADEARATRTTIGGKPAILEDIGETTFDMEQNEPVLKGLMICVSNVGNDEFMIVGKYKSDSEYQILQKIINSISFS